MHGTYFNATIAVYVTLNLRLGKDEVPGPNPGSSSNEKRSNLTVWVLFSALLQLLRTVRQFDETRLQHKTDTEADTTKKNEPDGIIPEVIK